MVNLTLPTLEEIKGRRGRKKSSEWGDLVDYFTDLANKYKKPTIKTYEKKYIAYRLSVLLTQGHGKKDYSLVYALQKKCKESNTPGSTFWYFLKYDKELQETDKDKNS